ncbi:Kelch repeat-containing protein, partial [Archangium sp.]|uniref:Kelch repeat-containing protein n=1 Tax=Archangium sp. TaxID=1872627 RepID=UPI002D5CE07B
MASAQTRTPWQMHDGSEVTASNPYGLVRFSCVPVVHGDACEYNGITVPSADDAAWRAAPNGDTIGFSIYSRVCNAPVACNAYGDFTYFQTFVDVPADTVVTHFTITFSGMDDGSRVSIYNSRYPGGLVIPGSYVYYGGTGTADLGDYIKAGETNRVVVTQVDDCCSGNNLHSAKVVLNGKVVTPGKKWTLTGSMALPRLQHTATRLDNGKVLVAGGFNTTAELYDSTTGTWSATGNTITSHRGHTATKLKDSRVLITGGGQCSFSNITAELYTPATGTWSSAGYLNVLRFHHTATLLPDGKVLVTGGGTSEYGGSVLGSAELYDPATGTWALTGSMSTPRRHHTATALPGGKVLIAGGNDGGGTLLSSAELYVPA